MPAKECSGGAVGGAYAFLAFVLAVVIVRVSPRGWGGRTFRTYLRLVPFSPFILILSASGLSLEGLGVILSWFGRGLRAVFEKATGKEAYKRQRRYSRYYYRSNKTEIEE